MRKRLLNSKSLILISFLIVLFDQLTKYYASNLLTRGVSTPLLPKLINLRLIENTGAAFSLFSNATWLLALLSLIVSIGLIAWIFLNAPMHTLKGISVACLLGGSLGNGIDRLRLGYVIDFLELNPINFPIFNVADIAINIAVLCFIIDTIKRSNDYTSA